MITKAILSLDIGPFLQFFLGPHVTLLWRSHSCARFSPGNQVLWGQSARKIASPTVERREKRKTARRNLDPPGRSENLFRTLLYDFLAVLFFEAACSFAERSGLRISTRGSQRCRASRPARGPARCFALCWRLSSSGSSLKSLPDQIVRCRRSKTQRIFTTRSGAAVRPPSVHHRGGSRHIWLALERTSQNLMDLTPIEKAIV